MAVLLEAISVVVRRSAVAARFDGGWHGFLETVPNQTICTDEKLVRVGFMSPDDAKAFVGSLTERGLTFEQDGVCVDLCVIQETRATIATDWVVCGQRPHGGSPVAAAWLANDAPGDVAVPDGWRAGSLQHMSPDEMGRRLIYLRHEDNLDVFRDTVTGKELFMGRTSRESGSNAIECRLKGMGGELVELSESLPPMFASGDEASAAPIFERVTQDLEPEARRIAQDPYYAEIGLAHHVHGMALRLLRRWEDAERSFREAHRLDPGVVSPLLELVWCLGEQDRSEEAVPFAEAAVRLDPTDVAALGNLASCLGQSGEIKKAKAAIDRALELEPGNAINQQIAQQIESKLNQTQKRRWRLFRR